MKKRASVAVNKLDCSTGIHFVKVDIKSGPQKAVI